MCHGWFRHQWPFSVPGVLARFGAGCTAGIIGVKLLAEVKRWAKGLGFDEIETRVAATNEGAQAFWRKAGFRSYMDMMFMELQ